jgi:hypothetical protein
MIARRQQFRWPSLAICLVLLLSCVVGAEESCPALLPMSDAPAADEPRRPARDRKPGDREELRWWRRSGEARAPVPGGSLVVPEDDGALTVQLELAADPGCDPVLVQLFAEELRRAVNAQPGLRVVSHAGAASLAAASAVDVTASQGPILPLPFIEQEPAISLSNSLLTVHVRSIHPYRPMRVDAALEWRDADTGQVWTRLDDVWQAPADSVVLRATRQGWLRRNWRPTPVMSETAALEANSPRLFLRSLAGQLAAALAESPSVTPTSNTPADVHDRSIAQ